MSLNKDRSFFFSLVCLFCVYVGVEKRTLMRRWPANRGSALPWSSFHRRSEHTWFGKSCTKGCTLHRLTQFSANNERKLCSSIWYINTCCLTNRFGARRFCNFHCQNFHIKLQQTLHVMSAIESSRSVDSIDMQITPIDGVCTSICQWNKSTYQGQRHSLADSWQASIFTMTDQAFVIPGYKEYYQKAIWFWFISLNIAFVSYQH